MKKATAQMALEALQKCLEEIGEEHDGVDFEPECTACHTAKQAREAIAALNAEISAPQEPAVNAELLDALETLCNGLEWNIENHPTIMNESDSEALADARAVIAKATGSAA